MLAAGLLAGSAFAQIAGVNTGAGANVTGPVGAQCQMG
jgi:hypothetical protein